MFVCSNRLENMKSPFGFCLVPIEWIDLLIWLICFPFFLLRCKSFYWIDKICIFTDNIIWHRSDGSSIQKKCIRAQSVESLFAIKHITTTSHECEIGTDFPILSSTNAISHTHAMAATVQECVPSRIIPSTIIGFICYILFNHNFIKIDFVYFFVIFFQI